MSEDLMREEVHHLVDRVVEEVLERAGLAAPPVDALALVRHLRLPVNPEDLLQTGRAKRTRGGRQAAPMAEASAEQQQWVAAHAIGEHFKPTLLERLGVTPEQARGLGGGSLVNLFAQHLLAPACWFGGDARACAYDLPQLKDRYPTASHELLALRLLDLAEPCIITIVDNEHIHRRRSNAWPVRRELSEPERQCQRYVHEYSRPRVVRAAGWTVQGWPVHQTDWKREILRSVVEDDVPLD
jgi:hypothetical protein